MSHKELKLMNTSNAIYTSYISKINIANADVEDKAFEYIFNVVRDGQLQTIVKQIRAESDHSKVQELKRNNLPIFFPTIRINGAMKNKLNDESTASGIVQFDIDLKDNLDLDMVRLKDEIIKLSETFYVFTSPSNGLKLAIRTDFTKHENESIENLRGRYLRAYDITKALLVEKLPAFNINFDKKVRPLKTACYLSDDSDVYFNQSCEQILLDHLCHSKVKTYKSIKTNQTDYRNFKTNALNFTPAQIKEMLAFIDPDKRHDNRIPINLVVMSALGADAIELLVNFWAKREKDQLRYQINDQFIALQSGKLEVIIDLFLRAAVAGGYINPFADECKTGSLRNTLKAVDLTDSTYTLPPLLSAEEAVIELRKVAKSFFNDKQSRFINFSTGAGKTRAMLTLLEEMGQKRKILYLVKSHVLADEIMTTFNALRAERIKSLTNRSDKNLNSFTNQLDTQNPRSKMVHLLGRGDFTSPNRLCENSEFLKSLAIKEDELDHILANGGELSSYKGGFHPFPSAFCGSDPNYKVEEKLHIIDDVQYCFEEDVQIDPTIKNKHEMCLHKAQCRYTDQFNDLFDNIRVMTHHEYFNLPSKYFSGTTADRQPRVNIYKNPRGGWVPDYIVIDEDNITVENDYKLRADNKRFPVVAKIIEAVQSGVDLKDAIMDNQADIFIEARKNKKQQSSFISTAAYLTEVKTRIKSELKFSELFQNIYLYAKNEEERYLRGMRIGGVTLFKNKVLSRVVPALIQSVIKTKAHRYRNIPTMFLDATANQSVIEELLPDVEFHSVNVESKDYIRLIQLQNYTFTKTELVNLKIKDVGLTADKRRKGVKFLDDVFYGLKNLAEKYTSTGKTVGVISYKNIPEITDGTGFDTFPAFLADKMSISLYSHFGNLRGSNAFDNVDCLIILGRYCLDLNTYESNNWAIFNQPPSSIMEYRDSPVRMRDGSIRLLNTLITVDNKSRAISEQCSLSETKQAIGRGRMVHGNPKDIYYLSNEYIGSDIEVTEFVSYDDLFLRMISDERLEALNVVGFLLGKTKDIMSALGIARAVCNTNKAQIHHELKVAGFVYSQIDYVKADSKSTSHKCYIKDESLLLKYLNPMSKHPVTIVLLD